MNSLPKIRFGAYVVSLDEYKLNWTYWIALYVNGVNVKYFDSFGVKYIRQKIKRFIENKNIATIIYITHAKDSIMCGYFCTGFINFILKVKSLLDFTNLILLMNMKRMIK